MKQKTAIRGVSWYWWYLGYLVVSWVILKLAFRLPEVINELWFKPVIWLVPLFWLNRGDRNRVKVFGSDWQKSLIAGAALGIGYLMVAVVVLGIKGWSISGNAVGIGLIAAVCENMAFFGLVLPAMIEKMGWTKGVIVCGVVYGLIHLPAAIGVNASWVGLMGVFLVSSTMGVMNGMARMVSGSVLVPILATWMWYGVLLG